LRGASDTQGKPFKLLAQECGNQEIADLSGSTASYTLSVSRRYGFRSAPTALERGDSLPGLPKLPELMIENLRRRDREAG